MYQLKIESMSCMNCVHHITEAVKSQDANAEVVVDLKNHLVSIKSELPVEKLVHAIEEDGYPVNSVE